MRRGTDGRAPSAHRRAAYAAIRADRRRRARCAPPTIAPGPRWTPRPARTARCLGPWRAVGARIAYDGATCSTSTATSSCCPSTPTQPRPTTGSLRSTPWRTSVGRERAQFILYKLLKRARQLEHRPAAAHPDALHQHHLARAGAAVPGRRADGAAHPAHGPLERGRPWCCAPTMALAGHRRPPRHVRVGGEPLRGRLQPLLPRQGRRRHGRPGLLPGPRRARASTRAPSSRAASPRRSSTTSAARSCPGRASPRTRTRGSCPTSGSSPRSRWASAPLAAIYQARFNRYLHAPRHQGHVAAAASGPSSATARPTSRSRWARCASPRARASTTSPSSSTATCSASTARCAATARSSRSSRRSSAAPAGTSSRSSGAASGTSCSRATSTACSSQRMNEVVDGESQKYSVESGAYIARALLRHRPAPAGARRATSVRRRDQGAAPRRPRLPQALRGLPGRRRPPRRARPSSSPRPSRAGRWAPASRRATSPTRPRSSASRSCASSATASSCPIPDAQAQGRALLPPGPRRAGDPLPAWSAAPRSAGPRRGASSCRSRCPRRATRSSASSTTGSGGQEASTTMAFAKLLRNLLRDEDIGERIVPIIPDEARTFGMDPLFKEVGIYSALGQLYDPVDSNLVLSYREAKDGQVLEEGITEAGSTASFQAAGTSLRDARRADDPVLHLLLDVRLPAHRRRVLGVRRRPRPRLPAGRHGRPHDAQRRGAPARGRPLPRAGRRTIPRAASTTRPSPTRPRPSSATASRGCTARRPRTSSTTSRSTTRTTSCRPGPKGSATRTSCAASTASAAGRQRRTRTHRGATLLASGVIMQQALARAGTCWPSGSASPPRSGAHLVPAAAQRGARGRALEPAPPGPEPRVPLVTELLAEPPAAGPIVAVSDWIAAWPDMISRWVPTAALAQPGHRRLRPQRHARGAAPLLRDRRPAHRRGRPRRSCAHTERFPPTRSTPGWASSTSSRRPPSHLATDPVAIRGRTPVSAVDGMAVTTESATQVPDAVLVEAARRGDLFAWERLVRRHQESVYRVAFLIVRDTTLAEDATQSTFVRAYRALPSFDVDVGVVPWLLRIAAGEARQQRRESGRPRHSSRPVERVAGPRYPASAVSGLSQAVGLSPAERDARGAGLRAPRRGGPPDAGPALSPGHCHVPRRRTRWPSVRRSRTITCRRRCAVCAPGWQTHDDAAASPRRARWPRRRPARDGGRLGRRRRAAVDTGRGPGRPGPHRSRRRGLPRAVRPAIRTAGPGGQSRSGVLDGAYLSRIVVIAVIIVLVASLVVVAATADAAVDPRGRTVLSPVLEAA